MRQRPFLAWQAIMRHVHPRPLLLFLSLSLFFPDREMSELYYLVKEREREKKEVFYSSRRIWG